MSILQLHVSNRLLSNALSTLSLHWLELCGHWLTGVECPCFHWLTRGVSMFPLAEALASPLPQESLNKHNSWKKHTISPAKKGKQSFPSLSLFVTPFWVIQILIHLLCSAYMSFIMTPKGPKDVTISSLALKLRAKIQVSLKCFQYKILSVIEVLWCYFCKSRVHTYWLNVIQSVNTSLYFVGMVFEAWHRSRMNNLVVLRSRPLETLTQFSLCLPGYLFENDSRVVPEKFEGEPAVPIIPLHSHTISFAKPEIHLARCELNDSRCSRETQANATDSNLYT